MFEVADEVVGSAEARSSGSWLLEDMLARSAPPACRTFAA
jgi:hypothetical protein